MSLIDHARAARIIGQSFIDKAEVFIAAGAIDQATIALTMAGGYIEAADRMEADDRDNLMAHGCTFDHRTIPTPKCAACGASRTAK